VTFDHEYYDKDVNRWFDGLAIYWRHRCVRPRAFSRCKVAIAHPLKPHGFGTLVCFRGKQLKLWMQHPRLTDGALRVTFGCAYAVYLPYVLRASASNASKLLFSLALPTGIEPVFQP
jgi:hypothetical protein